MAKENPAAAANEDAVNAKNEAEAKAKSLQGQADKFNAKLKPGDKVKYKNAAGKEAEGILKHTAQVKGDKVRVWILGNKEELTIENVTSKF